MNSISAESNIDVQSLTQTLQNIDPYKLTVSHFLELVEILDGKLQT
jgi:hypothetical protein